MSPVVWCSSSLTAFYLLFSKSLSAFRKGIHKMLTYKKMMKLHHELSASLVELTHHLEFVLGDIGYDNGVSAQIRFEEGGCLTISFYNSTQDMDFEALITDEKEFKQMMKLRTTEELISFLSARTIA